MSAGSEASEKVQRRSAIRALLGASLTAALLGGCGQRGPLFLPDEKLEELKRRRERQEAEDKTSRAPGATKTIG